MCWVDDAINAELPRPPSPPTTAASSREQLEAAMAELAERYPESEGGTVPMPETWGGYRIVPEQIQFWHGRPSRLHNRFQYIKNGDDESAGV